MIAAITQPSQSLYASSEIASHTPKTIVPREPTATRTVPTCETRISEATRPVLSVPQSETIMIQKITSAPTSAKAERTCSERIQSSKPTARGGYNGFRTATSGDSRRGSVEGEAHLPAEDVRQFETHRHRLPEREVAAPATGGDGRVAELDGAGGAVPVDVDDDGLEGLPYVSLEDRRLERRDDPRLVLAGPAVGHLHQFRQRRQRSTDPLRHPAAFRPRTAPLADVAIDQ